MARDRLEEDHALETRVIEEHNVWRATGVASDGSRRMSRAPAQLELVPPDALKAGKPRPGRVGGLYTAMREALSTDTGAGLYLQRQSMVEPVFADIKFNRRADRFQRPRQSRMPLKNGA